MDQQGEEFFFFLENEVLSFFFLSSSPRPFFLQDGGSHESGIHLVPPPPPPPPISPPLFPSPTHRVFPQKKATSWMGHSLPPPSGIRSPLNSVGTGGVPSPPLSIVVLLLLRPSDGERKEKHFLGVLPLNRCAPLPKKKIPRKKSPNSYSYSLFGKGFPLPLLLPIFAS